MILEAFKNQNALGGLRMKFEFSGLLLEAVKVIIDKGDSLKRLCECFGGRQKVHFEARRVLLRPTKCLWRPP